MLDMLNYERVQVKCGQDAEWNCQLMNVHCYVSKNHG